MNRAEKIAALKAIASGKATIEDLTPKPVEAWISKDNGQTYEMGDLILTTDELKKRRAEIFKIEIVYPTDYDMPPMANNEADVDMTPWKLINQRDDNP